MGLSAGKKQTDQSEGLSTGRLAVRKDDRIVAVHRGTHVVTRDGVVYGLVIRTSQNLIEIENRGSGGGVAMVLW